MLDRFGGIDVWVISAVLTKFGPLETIDDDEYLAGAMVADNSRRGQQRLR